MNFDFAGLKSANPESTRRIQLLKGLSSYLNDLDDSTVTVILFNHAVETPKEFVLQGKEQGRKELIGLLEKRFGQTIPDGGTNLYGALWSTLSRIDTQLEADPTRAVHVHLVSDGENGKSESTVRDIDAILAKLCERSKRNPGQFSMSYDVLGAKFDLDLKTTLGRYRDCLNVSIDEFRRPVSWSVTPRQVNLASFAELATQELVLRFDRNLPGYVAELRAEGFTVSPSTVAMSDTPQRIRVTGPTSLDSATHLLQVIPVHRAGEQVNPLPVAASISLKVDRPRSPSFSIGGVTGDYLELQTGERYTVRLTEPVNVATFRWECPEWPEPRTGMSQLVTFNTPGKRQITIQAQGPAAAGRQAPSTTRVLTVNVVAWGGAYSKVESLAFLNEAVHFDLKLVGDVTAKWLIDGALAPQQSMTGNGRLVATFGTAGKHRVQAVIIGKDGLEKPLAELSVDVIEKPVPAVLSPTTNSVTYVGNSTLFRIGNPEAFDGLTWRIGSREYPIPRGSRDLELRFKGEQTGSVKAVVSGRLRIKPDVITSTEVTIIVRELPTLEIVQPRDFAQVVLPPTGTVAVALELDRKSLGDVKADTITWVVSGGGEQPDHPASGAHAQVAITEEGSYIATVKGQAATGEWVSASSHFSVSRDLSLIIVEPAANALLSQGQRVLFAIDEPQAFDQVVWSVNNQTYEGRRVEIPMTQIGQAISVAVTATYKGTKQSAETQVTVIPPGIHVLEPLPNQTYLLAESDQARIAPRCATQGPIAVDRWIFRDSQGKVLDPPGDSTNGYVIAAVGDYTVTVQTRRTDDTSAGPESTPVQFRVEHPIVPYRIEARPNPPRVGHPVELELTGRPSPDSVQWDFGDGKAVRDGTVGTSHVYDDVSPVTVSARFRDARHDERLVTLSLEPYAVTPRPAPEASSTVRVKMPLRQHRWVSRIWWLGENKEGVLPRTTGVDLIDEDEEGDARQREWTIKYESGTETIVTTDRKVVWYPPKLGSYQITLRSTPYGGEPPIAATPILVDVLPARNWLLGGILAVLVLLGGVVIGVPLVGAVGRNATISCSHVGLVMYDGSLLGLDAMEYTEEARSHWNWPRRQAVIPLQDLLKGDSYVSFWLNGNGGERDRLLVTDRLDFLASPGRSKSWELAHHPSRPTTQQSTQEHLFTETNQGVIDDVVAYFDGQGNAVVPADVRAVAILFKIDHNWDAGKGLLYVGWSALATSIVVAVVLLALA